MECAVRLRVKFDDHRRILSKSQRSDGLRRCWLRLRPDLSTVSDLAAHLVDAFDLRRSCPYGVLLHMEDFVLPSFESTTIFRDNDVVRVRKKGIKKKLLERHGDEYHIQGSEILKKKTVQFVDKFLAIKDSQEDLAAHRSKNEVDACEVEETLAREERNLRRKRKRSSDAQKSKRKKSEHISSEKTIIIANDAEKFHTDKDETFDTLVNSDSEVQKENGSTDTEERDDQFENTGEIASEPATTDNVRKCSRSSKRKKAKRKWKQEQAKQQLEKMQGEAPENYVDGTTSEYQDHGGEDKDGNIQSNGILGQVLENDVQGKSSEDQVEEEAADREEDIVPIIVRPGHIRFEPLDEEHRNSQSNGTVETLKWNGTTKKKKGQKWGREKDTTMGYEDDTYSEAAHENFITDEKNHVNDPIDFESLFPLIRPPEEGDLLVYRVVELTSSWCPELSDFRVGKVSSYDPISTKIVLLPVPGYPIFPNKDDEDEESPEQPEPTLYKEDESLEIEYTSLLDIRLLKAHDLDGKQKLMPEKVAEPCNQELTPSETNSKLSAIPPSETESSMSWEQQLRQVVREKKAQLEKNNGQASSTPHKPAAVTTTTSRSYRVLRGSALGPTLALIRSQNGDDGNANSSGKHT